MTYSSLERRKHEEGSLGMQGHSTLILCDSCGTAIADQAAKEILYQVGKVRYRLELCATCLDREMRRHGKHRGVPGFRKRAAIAFTIEAVEDLPSRWGASGSKANS
jgi:hypothetical protein